MSCRSPADLNPQTRWVLPAEPSGHQWSPAKPHPATNSQSCIASVIGAQKSSPRSHRWSSPSEHTPTQCSLYLNKSGIRDQIYSDTSHLLNFPDIRMHSNVFTAPSNSHSNPGLSHSTDHSRSPLVRLPEHLDVSYPVRPKKKNQNRATTRGHFRPFRQPPLSRIHIPVTWTPATEHNPVISSA